MGNFGFISKKKVAREIAKIYHNYGGHNLLDSEVCSVLNSLCFRLKIKPMHLSKRLGAGTGEMLRSGKE